MSEEQEKIEDQAGRDELNYRFYVRARMVKRRAILFFALSLLFIKMWFFYVFIYYGKINGEPHAEVSTMLILLSSAFAGLAMYSYLNQNKLIVGAGFDAPTGLDSNAVLEVLSLGLQELKIQNATQFNDIRALIAHAGHHN